jgi:predicted CoA-substrate-specific enzyme activase
VIGAGVDVGSTATKAVIIDEARRVRGRAVLPTGASVVRAAERAFAAALGDAGLDEDEVGYVVSTGYGRFRVTFGDALVTEISCHARGAHVLFPATRTLLDIGGQDTKAIRLGPQGEVLDFCMNDKCAAGTGRFLEAAAQVLDLPLEALGPASLRARQAVRLTNVCTVFVESEIVSCLAQGRSAEEILKGVHAAIAARSASLLRRVGVEPELTFTGGVSRNVGMVASLEQKLGVHVNVSPDSQFMGALGAALYALERAEGGVARGRAQEARP